jgi:hypothetical protein
MRYLLTLILLGIMLAGCSSVSNKENATKDASAGNRGIMSIATDNPSALSMPMAVTVRPPAIPIGPIKSNPAFPVPTPTPFSIKGWQTFTSSNFRIAVDYPSDWSVTEQADGATFTSPQGARILLQSTQVNSDADGNNNSSQQCVTIITSYGLSVNTCFDPTSDIYSAEFKIRSAGDSIQLVTLSTKDKQALDVYKGMLNTLRQTQ